MSKATIPPTPAVSDRAQNNVKPNLMKEMTGRAMGDVYNPVSNPHGIIDMGSAMNRLPLKDLQKFLSSMKLDANHVFSYSIPTGSPKLLLGMADFFNDHFNPIELVTPANLMATNGVSGMIDIVTFAICNPGDGVLVHAPFYGMYQSDCGARNDIEMVAASSLGLGLNEVFGDGEEMLVRYEKAIQDAEVEGYKMKLMLICNPHNPTGRAYAPKVLQGLMNLCARYGLHMLVDEIFGMGVFEDPELPSFTSALSLKSNLPRESLHILYGASKDFGAGGIRLGFLYSQNKALRQALSYVGHFGWVSTFSDNIFSEMLADRKFIAYFLQHQRQNLRTARDKAAKFLTSANIPFETSNSSIVMWINLQRWLKYFSKDSLPGNGDKLLTGESAQEARLATYLMDRGVYVELGAAFFSPLSGRFRFCYTNEAVVLELGLIRLAGALTDLERGESAVDGDEDWDIRIEKVTSNS